MIAVEELFNPKARLIRDSRFYKKKKDIIRHRIED